MSEGSKSNNTLNVIKFVVFSLLGIFLFMVPLPQTAEGEYVANEQGVYEYVAGDTTFNIPLGYAINWIGGTINDLEVNGFGLLVFITAVVITVSFVGTLIAYMIKLIIYSVVQATSESPDETFAKKMAGPGKIMQMFLCSPIYFVSKAFAFAVAWMVFLSVGPDWLVAGWTGDLMLVDLVASSGGLMAIFLVIGIAIPILTDFGLMEFLGVLIKKVVRVLFTLPGRSSIDLFGSWFSSSAAGVIITRDQHEKGYYTDREAAAICVNFTLVSLPFTFVVASTIGLTGHFGLFYLIICITSILLAVLMPRIWPLSRIKDEYLPEVGKQINEEVPSGKSMFQEALDQASTRASKTSASDVAKSGVSNWVGIFMDLIPVILAWGTLALIIEAHTGIFDFLSQPFAEYLRILGVAGYDDYAAVTIVGFIDMFIPAILLGTTAPIDTRFILGALSIVQIIYLAETGILILKSKIPLNIGHLAILFVMRTVLALPVIVLLTRLLFNP